MNQIDEKLSEDEPMIPHTHHAAHATVIIDCAAYYRILHEVISKATKSIFIVGWDIDSRIDLLRNEKSSDPQNKAHFFDLVRAKARSNPSLQIYLNRWDYSLYMAGEREGLSKLRWRFFSPPNIHYHLDNKHPFGGCHHQKIVVVDDQIAFMGGMDIALGRWDQRQHRPQNEKRVDPGGTYKPVTQLKFNPHHDIQLMVSGPVVRALAEITRERWRRATGQEPVGYQGNDLDNAKPSLWPKDLKSDFENVPVALVQTMPAAKDRAALHEIEEIYLREIARAEKFIYIENQYLTYLPIARALNQQLLKKPHLRLLIVSCAHPQGIMERKGMWSGRVLFRDILMTGDVSDRAILSSPITQENGLTKDIRIHSKLMAIDDRFLHIGSANINNRSMGLDSECDLVIFGDKEETRQKIAALRTDLMREHTGMEAEAIENLIESNAKIEKFLNYNPQSRQHLQKTDDEKYRHQSFTRFAVRISDSDHPLYFWKKKEASSPAQQNKRLLFVLAFIVAIVALSLMWKFSPISQYLSPAVLAAHFHALRHSLWVVPAVIGVFILGTAVFFPLTLLIIATALAFPPPQAFLLALAGALSGASLGYSLGRLVGGKLLPFIAGNIAEKICGAVQNGGVMTITFLRLAPIAPLGIVDLSLGIAKVPFVIYFTGTILGLLPGIAIFCLLGHSLGRIWHDRSSEDFLYLSLSALAWLGLILMTHFLTRREQRAQAE